MNGFFDRFLMISKYEFKNLKWDIFIMVCMMYFFGVMEYVANASNDYINLVYGPGVAFSELLNPAVNIINLLWVMKLVASQFSEKGRTFMSSLPIKKSDLFISKATIGSFIITVGFLLYGFAISFTFDKYNYSFMSHLQTSGVPENLYDVFSKSSLFMNLAYTWLLFITFYFIMLFFKVIVRNGVLSSIFGCIACVYVSAVAYMTNDLYNFFLDGGIGVLEKISEWLNPVRFFTPQRFFIQNNIVYEENNYFDYSFQSFGNLPQKTIIIFVIFIVAVILSYMFYIRKEQNENRHMLVFKWEQKLFIALAVIGTTVFSGTYVMYIFESRIVTVAVMILFGGLAFFLSSLFVELVCGGKGLKKKVIK